MPEMTLLEKPYLKWVALFVASGTLICCALPILLVSLGFGAVVASLNYEIPALLFLAEYKIWTLLLAALVLIILAWVIWRPNQACPSDPSLAALCQKTKQWNKRVFWFSSAIWFIGFFTSYLLLPFRLFLES
ncbi:hypothetical protein FM038_008335 [Shewanella eurypsychrophilus]|uniref:Mercuric transport protein MerT n=1 Tax=Shewanella eurypsychrophilus TaxID=2593656 RepID=A0ABX6V480_9GAMM|nr:MULTISPECIES: hypothetical protein [Shewanella]QFU22159.1 hypothetical protein FS418_09915 [Shewanella sp. YLB-09]QPG57446.1 hypothetical protein FM038_008335 [Shewanella eurypsychrophilus]